MKKHLRLILIVVGVVAVLGAVGVFALPRLLPGGVHVQVGDPAPAAAAAGTPVPVEAGVPVTLGERIVNLADPGGFRYLKIEIVLSLSEPGVNGSSLTGDKLTAAQAKLDVRMEPIKPQIQDILTSVLTAKTVAQVSTPEGKEQLRQELISRLQPLFTEQQIDGLYFAQFVIQ